MILAERDGRVAVVDDRVVLVLPDDPSAEVQVCALRTERATLADGARVLAGDVVAEGDGAKGGALALGRLRVAFTEELAEGEVRVAERVSREVSSRPGPARRTRSRCATRRSGGRSSPRRRPARRAPRRATSMRRAWRWRAPRCARATCWWGGRRPRSTAVGATPRCGRATPPRRCATWRSSSAGDTNRRRAPSQLREAERALWARVEEVARTTMAPEADGALETLAERCRRQIERTYRGDDLPRGSSRWCG